MGKRRRRERRRSVFIAGAAPEMARNLNAAFHDHAIVEDVGDQVEMALDGVGRPARETLAATWRALVGAPEPSGASVSIDDEAGGPSGLSAGGSALSLTGSMGELDTSNIESITDADET